MTAPRLPSASPLTLALANVYGIVQRFGTAGISFHAYAGAGGPVSAFRLVHAVAAGKERAAQIKARQVAR